MSGAGGRRAQRSGGGGTLPADGFTYIGSEARGAAHAQTLNNGAPAHAHLNNGSLRSLPGKKNNRAAACHPDNFQRNVEPRYSRKQENGYMRGSETVLGFGRKEREYAEYSEPEYSVIPESYARAMHDYPRACPHSNTFNC